MDPCVILTPMATHFVDVERLTQQTGHPVRSEYKRPEETDVLPRADVLLVSGATFNTINKMYRFFSYVNQQYPQAQVIYNIVPGIICRHRCWGPSLPGAPASSRNREGRELVAKHRVAKV